MWVPTFNISPKISYSIVPSEKESISVGGEGRNNSGGGFAAMGDVSSRFDKVWGQLQMWASLSPPAEPPSLS